MTLVPTFGHQQHIIWNLFSKHTEIHVQNKYEKLNDYNLITGHLDKACYLITHQICWERRKS